MFEAMEADPKVLVLGEDDEVLVEQRAGAVDPVDVPLPDFALEVSLPERLAGGIPYTGCQGGVEQLELARIRALLQFY